MKTILETIKKHDNIVMIIIYMIISLITTHGLKLCADDTLWNFSNIYKMANGFEIYRDLNVIITPLYFYIGEMLFLKNYLIYQLYQTLIISMLSFSIYMLFKKLNIKKINSMIYTIIICIMVATIMPEANYNLLAISFVILGILQRISKKQNFIVQGIICFLIFMTKQNIGILYIVGVILSQILTQENKKILIINITKELVTFSSLLLGYFMYLIFTNNFDNFMNYTFLGVSEFAGKNINLDIYLTSITIITFITSLAILIITYKKIPLNIEDRQNIRIIAPISITMLAIVYPLVNVAHTLIANIVFSVLIFYTIDILIFRELLTGKKVEKIKKNILALLVIIAVVACIYNNIKYIKIITDEKYYFEKDSPYYGAISNEEIVNEINDVVNYIKEQNKSGNDVKVISCYSNLFMNVLNKNNREFDLPFNGNLGKAGVEGLIQNINKLENTKILIPKEEENMHFQESRRIFEYIQENFEKENELFIFSIYTKKR